MTPLADEPALLHEGMIIVPDFMFILIHVAAYRFGLVVELTVEAVAEVSSNCDTVFDFDHFAVGDFGRTNSANEPNPFILDHWSEIDTTMCHGSLYRRTQGTPRALRTGIAPLSLSLNQPEGRLQSGHFLLRFLPKVCGRLVCKYRKLVLRCWQVCCQNDR